MEEFYGLNRMELESKLPDEQIRITQIICLAMMIGVFMFMAILIFMYFQNENINNNYADYDTSSVFSVVLVIIAGIVYTMFNVIPKIIFSPEKIKQRLSQGIPTYQEMVVSDPVIRLLLLHRAQMIIKMAMLEGVALFGLVNLFYFITDGTIYTNNNYWLVLIPAFIMFVYIIINFPTKQKIAEQIEKDFLEPLRSAR